MGETPDRYYDTATGDVFWGYIFLTFASIFVFFIMGGVAVYWLGVVLGRIVDALAGAPRPRA